AMRRKSLKKKIFLRVISRLKILNSVYFHVTDEQEAKDVRKHLKSRNIIRVPNIPNVVNTEWNKRQKQQGYIKLIFISRIDPKKNLDFAIHSMRLIPTECSVEFNIFGSVGDAGYYDKCRSI